MGARERCDKKDGYLFQGLVIDKAGGIFRDLQLALLDLFAELPAWRNMW